MATSYGATGSGNAATLTTKRERINVLSINMFIRPEGIHSGQWFGSGDHKDLRVSLLLRKIRSFDIVLLQEMFEAGVRQRRFVKAAYDLGFKYHAGSVWPSLTDTHLIDGGLLILSRFPIVERAQHVFSRGSGADGICAKGVLYARVQLSPDLADSLHVFTTHTEAGDRVHAYEIRASQLNELKDFVAKTLHRDPYSPLLISGDFNLDARHDLTHADNGDVVSRPCSETVAYQTLFNNLHSVLAAGRKLLDLMKLYDTTKLADNVHPITNGDGHATLTHVCDPQSPEKDGKCIDYLFFSPGVRERRSVSGDIPTLHLRVVPDGTRVDHADIASLFREQDGSTSPHHTKDEHHQHDAVSSLLPITHLSDHYGLRATLELETTPVGMPDGSVAQRDMRIYEILQHHFPPRAFAQKTKTLWQWKVRVLLLAIVATAATTVYVVGSVLWNAIAE